MEGGDNLKEDSKKAGATGILIKPFEAKKLEEVVKKLIGKIRPQEYIFSFLEPFKSYLSDSNYQNRLYFSYRNLLPAIARNTLNF